jgi:hypothetical protein
MQTFTIIDSNSGLVWGTTNADTIIDACRMVDEGVGCHGHTYADDSGADFMADDYAAVSALAVAGYVTRSGSNR